MKKLIASIIAASVALVFAVTGCGGTYVPPSGSVGGDTPSTSDPVKPDDQATGDFTVRLVNQDGTLYTATAGLTVIWNDGATQPVTAEFGEDNIARTSGLDGEYRITVTGLSKRYVYDPNGYIATNLMRKVDVTVYRVNEVENYIVPGQNGKTLSGAIELPREGAFRVTLDSAASELYFLYEPKRAGMYEVRSLINIDDNAINPKYRECFGMRSGVRYADRLIDGGGAANTFTNNFLYEQGYNIDEIGNILLFGVSAAIRGGEYPVTVDFQVKRTGDYVRNDINSTIVVPKEFAAVQNGEISEADFSAKVSALIAGKSGGLSNFVDIYKETNNLLNGDDIAFDKTTGYYRFYDEDTETYGPVICAKITANVALIGGESAPDAANPSSGMSFAAVEWQGNKALTINDNYDWNYKKTEPKYGDRDPRYLNYKVFIEGYEGIVRMGHSAGYTSIEQQFADYKGVKGYADFAIAGVYPVNEELRRFLQGYATSARLFRDGNGFAELSGVRSAEEDQWLFACGYFI